MRTFTQNSINSGTTNGRIGNGTFCSIFGRNITDTGSDVKNITIE